ncbi:hypothetical protein [Nocardia sp. NPDC046763]|uniref:hypothetical protein n=1 Tax=Nocardia sp. NPDC046763 TaxID=3155256 RepID=UPI0033F987A8
MLAVLRVLIVRTPRRALVVVHAGAVRALVVADTVLLVCGAAVPGVVLAALLLSAMPRRRTVGDVVGRCMSSGVMGATAGHGSPAFRGSILRNCGRFGPGAMALSSVGEPRPSGPVTRCVRQAIGLGTTGHSGPRMIGVESLAQVHRLSAHWARCAVVVLGEQVLAVLPVLVAEATLGGGAHIARRSPLHGPGHPPRTGRASGRRQYRR